MKDFPATNAAAPRNMDALSNHILTRYHNVHRVESADLQPLARKIATVRDDLDEEKFFGDLAAHIALENDILSPRFQPQ